MTFFTALLFIVVIALVLTGALVLLMWLEKKLPSKQYDERQETIRGKAYKWACVTGLCYFFTVGILDLVLQDGVQADLFLVVMIGVTLASFVCECYCCFYDAYLPLTKSPKTNIIMLYALAAVYLLNATSRVARMRVTVTEDGFKIVKFSEVMLTVTGDSAFVWGFLMLAVTSITIATMELVRYMRNKME
jgi:hypothetical protein